MPEVLAKFMRIEIAKMERTKTGANRLSETHNDGASSARSKSEGVGEFDLPHDDAGGWAGRRGQISSVNGESLGFCDS